MPERLLRTFIALAVPKQIVAVGGLLKTTMNVKHKALRWVKPNAMHLTLKFNGTTPPDSVPAMEAALKEVAAKITPFRLEVQGTGCFPSPTRPRVLWLGIGGEVDKLQQLVAGVHCALAELGYPDESKDYHPHVTLARIKYPQKQTPDITSFLNTEYQAISMQSDRIHLISSELLPTGPVYTNLGTYYFSPDSK